ncbi:unnamed protein product [Caenorhabditis nigoni]
MNNNQEEVPNAVPNDVIPERIEITVRSHAGRPEVFEMSSNDTIGDLQKRYQWKTGVPIVQICFIHRGKHLYQDEKTLSECGIGHLSLVYMRLRLAGGGVVEEKRNQSGK